MGADRASLFYALGACILGLIFSFVLGFTLVRGLTGAIWWCTFRFTILPALVTCAFLLIAGFLVPVLALKSFNKGSIVDQLRISEQTKIYIYTLITFIPSHTFQGGSKLWKAS